MPEAVFVDAQAQSALRRLGWHDVFAAQLQRPEETEALVARVIEEQKRYYFVDWGAGSVLAEVSGRLRHGAKGRASFPAVGDWVVLSRDAGRDEVAGTFSGGGTRDEVAGTRDEVAGTFSGRARGLQVRIERVLERRTKLSRKAAGEEDAEQILCTNVDTGFVVAALDGELNPRRLERYLTTIRGGGARPVVVLTKPDLCADLQAALASVHTVAAGCPVLVVQALSGDGVAAVEAHLRRGETAVMLGSSGVGKSTLINALAGEPVRAVGAVRAEDGKGRHTTTARTLVPLRSGALIIDTPGMRELEVWQAEPALADAFVDVASLSAACRFRDCAHQGEPGCAVRAAVENGDLPRERLDGYLKLRAEAGVQSARATVRARAERHRVDKGVSRSRPKR